MPQLPIWPRYDWHTILDQLSDGREMYGLQMVEAAPDKLGRNSVYVILMHMNATGALSARLETDVEQKRRGPKRRLYKITDVGRRWRIDYAQSTNQSIGQLKPI